MASERQIHVGGVPIGGGAPVAVQTMTKTETANLQATMDQIRTVAEAGADIVRVAVPREQDVEALKTIVARVADPGDRRHPLQPHAGAEGDRRRRALRAAEPGQHRRPRQGRRGRRARQAPPARRCASASTPARCPSTCASSSATNPVEALVTAAIEFVELMERLDFDELQGLDEVDDRAEHDRLQPPARPSGSTTRCTSAITEAGTKWSGSLKSAVGLGTLLADGIGDTIRISLSTFHAEEEVKVAWEILKALKLRERGPVLIACPTCGRLQFDMDTVVAEVERRLEAYDDPIEVSVLGCAVNGIGEARHADFGITGAKDAGMIFSKGEPLQEGPDRAARRRAVRRDRQLLRRAARRSCATRPQAAEARRVAGARTRTRRR